MTVPSAALARSAAIAAGTTVSTLAPSAPAETPATPHPAVATMRPRWAVCRDLSDGVDAVRAKGATYLPKAPAELPEEFDRRLKDADLYNMFARTLTGLVGMVFRHEPTLRESVPPALRTAWEDIDGAGTHGAVFARRLFRDAWRLGHAGILVDAPPAPAGLTLADERAAGVRPYWCPVAADQIHGWRWDRVNGQTVLGLLVLSESITTPTGRYGVASVEQFRVFVREAGGVTYELWQKAADGATGDTKWQKVSDGRLRNVTEIPFAPLPIGDADADPLQTQPPLYALAQQNLAHYRVLSDRRYSLHIANVPILTIKGRDTTNGAVPIGPNTGLDLPVDGDAFYCEHKGTALQESREELREIEHRIAAQGLGMLDRTPRANETAQAKRLDKSEQDSPLAASARALQDCLETALGFHAAFLGLDGGGEVEVARDFDGLALDPQQITAFAKLQESGQISVETLWEILQAGHVLPDDFDPVREATRLLAAPVAAPLEPAPVAA
jgi:hypothetical protein